MSSPPPETETHDIEFSRDEQWIVHHALVTHVNDAIDDGDSPPSWAIDVLEAVESGDETETLTGYQARRLHEVVAEFVERSDTPEADVEHGSAALERLEATVDLES